MMKKALIIEDDPDQAALSAYFLQDRDFETSIAGTGEAGLSAAAETVPDLIVLDLMLPDLDGYEVCRRLRSESRTRCVPILMVTALADCDHRRRGFRVGANAYVSKPYSAADFKAGVECAMQWKRHLRQELIHGEVKIEMQSVPAFLHEANELFVCLCRETPLSPEQINQLQQALLEMGQNAIEWGNSKRPNQQVDMVYRIYHDRVEITIRDQGRGFNPQSLPHAASAEDPLSHMDVREQLGLRDGGFGLLIARGMLDELRHNEQGNEVTLIKRYSHRLDPSTN